MIVKDLKDFLRGIPNAVEVTTGNFSVGKPCGSNKVLNIDVYSGIILDTPGVKTVSKYKITEVVLWFEE